MARIKIRMENMAIDFGEIDLTSTGSCHESDNPEVRGFSDPGSSCGIPAIRTIAVIELLPSDNPSNSTDSVPA